MNATVPPVPPPPPQTYEAPHMTEHNAAFVAAQATTIANAFRVLGVIEGKAIRSLTDSGDQKAVADIAARERISNVVRIYCAFVSRP